MPVSEMAHSDLFRDKTALFKTPIRSGENQAALSVVQIVWVLTVILLDLKNVVISR